MKNNLRKDLNAVSTRSGWDIVNDLELFPANVIITDNDGDEKHPEPDDFEINYNPLVPTKIELVLPESGVNVGDAVDPKDIIVTTPGYASVPELEWVIINGEVEGEVKSLDEVIAAEEPLKDEEGNVVVDEKTGLPVYPDTCAACYGNTIQFVKEGTVTIAAQSQLYPDLFTTFTVTITAEEEEEEEETTTYTWKIQNGEQTVTTTTKEIGACTVTIDDTTSVEGTIETYGEGEELLVVKVVDGESEYFYFLV